jgi:UPF0716 protein FxsA
MPYILLLFILMPIIEIAVLIQVGGAIGLWATLAIVILTAVLGTAMLRQQGLATMNQVRQRLGAGEMPAQQIIEGLLLLVGGVLLLTPGFVTDAFGFTCLFPLTRQWLARQIAARSMGHMNVVVGGMGPGSSANGPAAGHPFGDPAAPGGRPHSGSAVQQPTRTEGDVIEGDFRRDD